jgi:hypothetical protein
MNADRISTWSFYDPSTGLFSGHQFTGHESTIDINAPPEHKAAEGCHDPLLKRVNIATGEVEDYQPPQPSDDHEWHHESRRWRLSEAVQAKQHARAQAMAQIHVLETQCVRPLRELALGIAGALDRLASLETQIAAERLKL